MPLPNTIYQNLNDFLKPKINFSTKFNEYIYNDKWILEVDQDYFNTAVYDLISDVNDHLIQGKNNRKFLMEILQIAELKYQWFNDHSLRDLKTISHVRPTIREVDYNLPSDPIPLNFGIADLIDSSEAFIEYEKKNSDFTQYIESFQNITNNFEEPLDFEKTKVLFALALLYKSLNKINWYIESLLMDLEYLDFSEFDFEEIMVKHEIAVLNTNDKNHQKCFANLSKTDVANLFNMLMEEDIIFMEKNGRKDEVALKKFIEKNFTYRAEPGNYKAINRINKEFGYVTLSEHIERTQLPFLEDMIAKLTSRKLKVEQHIEKYKRSAKK